jgi:adenine deaminase
MRPQSAVAPAHSVLWDTPMHDLVIRNGLIVDGSGGPAFVGDLAIDGQRIVAVAKLADPVLAGGRREIDAGNPPCTRSRERRFGPS